MCLNRTTIGFTLLVTTAVMRSSIPGGLHAEPQNSLAGVLRELAAVLRNPKVEPVDVERTMHLAAAMGPDGVPLAPAILDRVDLMYRSKPFVNDADFPGIPSASVNALSAMGAKVVPTLIEALQRNQLVRLVALRAIAQMPPAESQAAVPALVRAATENRPEDPKWEVFREDFDPILTLGRMGDVAVPALVSLAANADLNIRTSAIRSLAGPTDRFDEILPTLLRALQDARKRLKDDAIYALGRIKRSSPEVIAELTRIAEQDSDSQTREAAKSLLKELRPR